MPWVLKTVCFWLQVRRDSHFRSCQGWQPCRGEHQHISHSTVTRDSLSKTNIGKLLKFYNIYSGLVKCFYFVKVVASCGLGKKELINVFLVIKINYVECRDARDAPRKKVSRQSHIHVVSWATFSSTTAACWLGSALRRFSTGATAGILIVARRMPWYNRRLTLQCSCKPH